jgi:hypothetical protein
MGEAAMATVALQPNKWPSKGQMNAFYGDPDVNNDGAPDLQWEQRNLTKILPPYQLYYNTKPVKLITCHRLVANSLNRCLTVIGAEFDEEERAKYELDVFGGVYNFRAKRGNPESLSIHSWAAAIDLSPRINAFRVRYGSVPNMMPARVVEIFRAESWTWGGPWRNADGMHFQAAAESA